MTRALNWRRSLGGGETRPQVFECDDGQEWVLKLPDNPHLGTAGLCADWIGTMLASRAHVHVVECALIEIDVPALATLPTDSPTRPWIHAGIGFGSLYLADSKDVLGLRAILESATSLDLARIVVVDTWLDVLDRKKPGQGAWNLLLDTRQDPPSLAVIDYGLGLGEILGPPVLGGASMEARFPSEWRPYVHSDDLEAALQDVYAVPDEEIEAIVQSIPELWVVTVPSCYQVPAYLRARREWLATAANGEREP